uniref:Uncharacterized protein n=1 Tax=Lactuca sativa TaxID=4236 RepID=A0A9R1V0I3_LACSA|nr:hypothetical protein LSAT_V11C700354240 [Lactuca sativa]
MISSRSSSHLRLLSNSTSPATSSDFVISNAEPPSQIHFCHYFSTVHVITAPSSSSGFLFLASLLIVQCKLLLINFNEGWQLQEIEITKLYEQYKEIVQEYITLMKTESLFMYYVS